MFFPVVNKSLYSHEGSIPLEISNIALPFKILIEFHAILKSGWMQITLYFVNSYCHSIFVQIFLHIKSVSQTELHLISKWFNQIIVCYPDFLRKYILHHLQYHVCIYHLENAVSQFVRLVIHRSWYEHLAHGIPVETHIFQFLKLYDGARVLLPLLGFRFFICVQFDISDGDPETKGGLWHKEVVFIPNMNVFNVILDTPEQPRK